jgi:hypothetical protein
MFSQIENHFTKIVKNCLSSLSSNFFHPVDRL